MAKRTPSLLYKTIALESVLNIIAKILSTYILLQNPLAAAATYRTAFLAKPNAPLPELEPSNPEENDHS
jgi:hypothetical protein